MLSTNQKMMGFEARRRADLEMKSEDNLKRHQDAQAKISIRSQAEARLNNERIHKIAEKTVRADITKTQRMTEAEEKAQQNEMKMARI